MENNKRRQRTQLAPNEVPVKRWVAFFFAAMFAAIIAQTPTSIILRSWSMTGVWSWLPETFCTLLGFAISLLFAALLLRWICKTSLRDLILGVGGKVDWQQCGKIAAAWIVGFFLTLVVDAILTFGSESTTTINPIGALPIIVNFFVCLLLVWSQTTWEEVLYRCVFLRATCKNNIRPTFKCIAAGVIATALFMFGHFANPEMTSQTTTTLIVAGALSYFISGIVMYMADVVYGTCMPGCVIHWINNFVLFAFLTQTGSALESGALFVSNEAQNGIDNLLGTVILYIPIVALLIHDAIKAKRNASAAREA